MRICLILVAIAGMFISGCAAPKIKLFPDETEPLREFVLQGEKKDKILMIPIKGIISDEPRRRLLFPKPSMVQEVVSQLRLAEKDKNVRAVLFKIDSPGGSTTASDILYHEIMRFKEKTGVKIVVAMMNLATSGAYFISLPADHIVAHPTTVTGSIGVIFLYPRITGLMNKIGLEVEVNKSGKNKDMASPFREPTEEERRIFQNITEELGVVFLNRVVTHRKLSKENANTIATGRVYLAKEALRLGLVDEIGYLNDAIKKAKMLANLHEDARVVVYRRTEYPDDNLYNTNISSYDVQRVSLFDLNFASPFQAMRTGFYYLWMPSGSRMD
ncbi:MAG: signal peptide peptidase SppA [Deltaproteobacteria bacterium]|nr:signal peptide peptidase SppA [Deltaproteobacteria bacterium]MBW1994497.1 signal peptide peptidase SppA [Deltaproteobacteria bacterium]MBW2153582.1 signal peptide peptidase SppA [Deltaproteobacteria bacterium]